MKFAYRPAIDEENANPFAFDAQFILNVMIG